MKKIPVLILDDEPLAVKLLKDFAEKSNELEVIFAGTDAFEAINCLKTKTVDLVFIDIQMPEMTGIEFMKLFNKNHNFIITTAYHDYTVVAYQWHFVDYLLKPITFVRFQQSVAKYINWKTSEAPKKDYLIFKADRVLHKVKTSDIIYIEGLRDYIQVHTKEKSLIVYENMKTIIEDLPQNFMRIHRSYIVNTNCIEALIGNQIKLTNNKDLSIGETYRVGVKAWFE